MKYTIYTETTINAPIDKVWSHFRDFTTHDQWNTFLRIHGSSIEIGKAVKVDFLDGEKVKMTMKPTVLKDEQEKSFEWIGHLFIKGLFDGHHQFHFDKIDDHTTKFIQKENFSGILIRILKKSVLDPTKEEFVKMNESFKSYVQSSH